MKIEYFVVERYPIKAKGKKEWDALEVLTTEDDAYIWLLAQLDDTMITRHKFSEEVEGYSDEHLKYLYRVTTVRKLRKYL